MLEESLILLGFTVFSSILAAHMKQCVTQVFPLKSRGKVDPPRTWVAGRGSVFLF